MADQAAPGLGGGDRQWRVGLLLAWPLALWAAPRVLAVGDLPLCALRHFTGVPCPLCGGTRLCAALADGQLDAAWQANPALLLLLVLALAHSAQLVWETVGGRRLRRWRIGADAWRVGVVVLLLGWLARLAGWV